MSGLTAKVQILRLEIEQMIDRLDAPDHCPESTWFCNQPLRHVPGRLNPPPISPDPVPRPPPEPRLLSRLARWANPPPPPSDLDAWRYCHPDAPGGSSPAPWSPVPARRFTGAIFGKPGLRIIGPPSALNASAAAARCRLPTTLIVQDPAAFTTPKLPQRRYNIAHYVSALSAIPAGWTRHFSLLNEMDPSQFSRAAFRPPPRFQSMSSPTRSTLSSSPR